MSALSISTTPRRRKINDSISISANEKGVPIDESPNPAQPLSIGLIYAYLKRKLPAVGSLLIGIVVGLLVAQSLQPSSGNSWASGISKTPTWAHSNRVGGTRHNPYYTPTLDQRHRVFNVLSTMPGYHTKECTRTVQPSYRRQVYERYEPLVGYQRLDQRRSAFKMLHNAVPKAWKAAGGFDHGYGDEEVDRIFKSPERGHRRFSKDTDSLSGTKKEDGSKDTKKSGTTQGKHRADVGNWQDGHKYFFAINLYNSFDIIPDLFSTMFKVSSILGFQNVFVSVYENGSTDQTKALLRLFDALARSVGLRVVIRTSLRTRGAFHHRIEYLAEVRNAALAPLQELRDAEGEVFDSVIFQNDVLPCVDDVLELIWQSRRQNAGITCGADYIYHDEINQPVFYDNWVSRDMNGTALENAPFEAIFRDAESGHRFQRHLPIQVQSCWNGIAVLDPAPMYAHPHVRFRMARLGEGECSASECSLICNDYWEAGYGRILMVPRVKLAYDKQVWDVIHPDRRNLTIIRAYSRLGGHPDDPNSDPQDRSWFGPHDRLFRPEESEPLEFKEPPGYVWCWGWDGAGDIEGPDVEPVWEPLKNYSGDPRIVRHDRSWGEL